MDCSIACGKCGCRSTLTSAYKTVYSFKGQLPFCPHCAEQRRQWRTNTLWLGTLLTLLGVLILDWMDIRHDLLWILFIVAGFLLSKLVSVIPHELGHAWAARLVGYKPLVILWGDAQAVLDFRLLGVRMRIGRAPDSAVTFFEPVGETMRRLKHILVTAAGVTVNILLGWLAIAVAVQIALPAVDSVPKAALLVFGVANFSMALANLWPSSIDTISGKIPNDGMRLFELITRGPPDLAQCRAMACQIRMHLAWEDGEYDRVMAELDTVETQVAEAPWVDVARSAGWCRLGKPQSARSAIQSSLLKEDIDPGTRALLHNNLAWANFISDDAALEEGSLEASLSAYDVLPWFSPVAITRACVLAAYARPGSQRLGEAQALVARVSGRQLSKESRQALAVAKGLIATALGDAGEAKRQLELARHFRKPGLAERVLEARLPSN
jgi:hypothetical protein